MGVNFGNLGNFGKVDAGKVETAKEKENAEKLKENKTPTKEMALDGQGEHVEPGGTRVIVLGGTVFRPTDDVVIEDHGNGQKSYRVFVSDSDPNKTIHVPV